MTSTMIASAPSRSDLAGAGHLTRFLDAAGIDRDELESFVLRQYPASARLFFVSTVVQGLAGSTSDIDVIVISPDADMAASPMSTMMFREGRRIGVKAYGEDRIDAALKIVAAEAAARDDPEDEMHILDRVAHLLPVLWVDLERLVQGVGRTENPYADHSPILGELAAKDARRRMIEKLALARLAKAAEQHAACLVYASEAIAAAQVAVLARSGQFNSNAKWTFVQWSRQFGTMADTTDRSIRLIDAAYRAAMTAAPTQCSEVLDLVGKAVSGLIGPAADPAQCMVALKKDVRTGTFVSGAVYLNSQDAFAVLDAELAARVIPAAPLRPVPQETAAALLDLARRGLVAIRPVQFPEAQIHA